MNDYLLTHFEQPAMNTFWTISCLIVFGLSHFDLKRLSTSMKNSCDRLLITAYSTYILTLHFKHFSIHEILCLHATAYTWIHTHHHIDFFGLQQGSKSAQLTMNCGSLCEHQLDSWTYFEPFEDIIYSFKNTFWSTSLNLELNNHSLNICYAMGNGLNFSKLLHRCDFELDFLFKVT